MSGFMDKKKMLSHSGKARSAFVSVLAALLCILIGLVCEIGRASCRERV